MRSPQADSATMNESYNALLHRINGTSNPEELRRIDRAATSVYTNGCLSASQLQKIDNKIMQKIAQIETR